MLALVLLFGWVSWNRRKWVFSFPNFKQNIKDGVHHQLFQILEASVHFDHRTLPASSIDTTRIVDTVRSENTASK